MRQAVTRPARSAWAVAGAVAALLAADALARLYVDWLWYGEVGYRRVWLTARLAPYALGLPAGAAAGALWYLSTWRALTGSGGPWWPPALPPWQRRRWLRRGLVALAALPALAVGGTLAAAWPAFWLYLHQVPFRLRDPLFGRDAAFYVFSLPVYRLLLQAAATLLILALLAAAAAYALGGAVYALGGRLAVEAGARRHLALLATGLLAVKAASYGLDRYALLTRAGGAAFGAGFVDVHVRLPALTALAALSALAAGAALWAGVRRDLRPLYAALAVLAVVALGTEGAAALVQRLVVEPNELARERPYLAHAIRFTRHAFGLEGVRIQPLDAPAAASGGEPADTFAHVRLWDPRPLRALLNQVQAIRPYYVFADVDVDRYILGGRLRQVLLAVRELDPSLLPEPARTWVNVHLKYTHGYGLVAVDPAAATPAGQPVFWLRDIPPRAEAPELRVARPQIYYGERTAAYAVVGTREDEFDHPRGDGHAVTRYAGRAGIPVGGLVRRAALALRLRDLPLFLSPALGPESRVLLHRQVHERVARVAPWVVWDPDPYPVIRPDGRVAWILDGLVVARGFPYAEPYHGAYARHPALQGVSYVRAGVKAVVDAYDGTVALYAVDEADPLVATLARAFPGLLRPAAQLPADLRAHLRYPEDLFRVQAEVYARYHVTDPAAFYHQEDAWAVAQEVLEAGPEPMEPYYVVLRLPHAPAAEQVLLVPFTPQRRENLVALLVARQDPARYGELVALTLPKEELVFGPLQVENRIQQDPVIARDLALWNQRGLRVLRGNLLVVPWAGEPVYVEPVFLQAEQRGLPELKRVIVVRGERVAMGERLEDALRQVLGEAGLPARAGPPAPEPPPDLAAAVAEAARLYEEALAALRAGDFAAFGQRLRRLGELLEHLRQQVDAQGR